MFHRIDPDAKICGPDLGDGCSNSDDGQVCGNVGGNEDWALWDEDSHDFYMMRFRASSSYKPPRSRKMPVSSDKFFMLYFNANLFEQTAAEANRYITKNL
jgi:hypothetical protein